MILQINNSNCEGVISLKTGLFIPCVNHTLKNWKALHMPNWRFNPASMLNMFLVCHSPA